MGDDKGTPKPVILSGYDNSGTTDFEAVLAGLRKSMQDMSEVELTPEMLVFLSDGQPFLTDDALAKLGKLADGGSVLIISDGDVLDDFGADHEATSYEEMLGLIREWTSRHKLIIPTASWERARAMFPEEIQLPKGNVVGSDPNTPTRYVKGSEDTGSERFEVYKPEI